MAVAFSLPQAMAAELAGPMGYLPILAALAVLVHHEVVRVARADEQPPVLETQTARVTRFLIVFIAFWLVALRLIAVAS